MTAARTDLQPGVAENDRKMMERRKIIGFYCFENSLAFQEILLNISFMEEIIAIIRRKLYYFDSACAAIILKRLR